MMQAGEVNDAKSEVRPVRRRWWKRWRVLLVLAHVPILLVVLAHVVLSWRIDAAVERIRARGEPVTREELIAAQMPPSREAARLRSENANVFDLGAQAVPRSLEYHEEAMLTQDRGIDALNAATNERNGWLIMGYTDEYSMTVYDLVRFNNAMHNWGREVAVAVERGNADRAVRALREMWRISHPQEGKPFTTADHLVCQSIRTIASRHARWIIEHLELNDTQLNEMLELFRPDLYESDFHRAIMGNRVIALERYRTGIRYGGVFTRLEGFGYQASGLQAMDWLTYVNSMERLVEITGQPPEDRWGASRALTMKREGISSYYTRICEKLFQTFPRALLVETRTIVELRMTRAAIAVERFRRAEGRLPDSLVEVAPRFIDSVPMDPFGNRAIGYRKTEKGYVVYSTGEDGVDHGGTPVPTPNQYDAPGYDIVFTVERPSE